MTYISGGLCMYGTPQPFYLDYVVVEAHARAVCIADKDDETTLFNYD